MEERKKPTPQIILENILNSFKEADEYFKNNPNELPTTKAKFKCKSITMHSTVNDNKQVKFEAVIGDSGENADYSKYTPYGELMLSISPETKAYDLFEEGKEYYLTIVEAV